MEAFFIMPEKMKMLNHKISPIDDEIKDYLKTKQLKFIGGICVVVIDYKLGRMV